MAQHRGGHSWRRLVESVRGGGDRKEGARGGTSRVGRVLKKLKALSYDPAEGAERLMIEAEAEWPKMNGKAAAVCAVLDLEGPRLG